MLDVGGGGGGSQCLIAKYIMSQKKRVSVLSFFLVLYLYSWTFHPLLTT